jgi:hypothetical protein
MSGEYSQDLPVNHFFLLILSRQGDGIRMLTALPPPRCRQYPLWPWPLLDWRSPRAPQARDQARVRQGAPLDGDPALRRRLMLRSTRELSGESSSRSRPKSRLADGNKTTSEQRRDHSKEKSRSKASSTETTNSSRSTTSCSENQVECLIDKKLWALEATFRELISSALLARPEGHSVQEGQGISNRVD